MRGWGGGGGGGVLLILLSVWISYETARYCTQRQANASAEQPTRCGVAVGWEGGGGGGEVL